MSQMSTIPAFSRSSHRPLPRRRDALPRSALRVRAPGVDEQPMTRGAHEAALTAEEMAAERDAALRAGSGSLHMLHAEAAETALLSAEEEVALFTRVRAGDRAALERAVAANVRLVGAVARYFARAVEHSNGSGGGGGAGMDLDDLMQEGMLGLWKAVQKFDPQRGHKFSTYATWWIRQSICRALADKGSAIRLPAHLDARCRQLNRVAHRLEAETGQKPDAATLAAALGWEEQDVRDAQTAWARRRAPISLDAAITPHAPHVSRRVQRGHGGDFGAGGTSEFTLADLAPDERAEEAFEEVERRADADGPESVRALIADLRARGRLSARDVEIIERRAIQRESLEAVRAHFGVSRERIRQLEVAAYKRVRDERARRRKQQREAEREAQQGGQQAEGGRAS